jgi:hypothetical protein
MARKNGPVRRFDSLAALVEYGDRPFPHGSDRCASRETSNNKWSGSDSWEDAKTLAFGGWADGAARVQKRRAAIGKMVHGASHAVQYARRGPGALSMERYQNGHPRPYGVLVEVKGKPKVVRILVNVCVSAVVSSERIERRGAAVCALVDALESNGRTVELSIVSAHETGYAIPTYYATIKRAGARLNLSSVAFAVAHPSMLRRVVFAACEQETGKVWDSLRYGYGTPTDVTPEPDTIYLGTRPGTGDEFGSDESAAAWVTARAAEQGVTLT